MQRYTKPLKMVIVLYSQLNQLLPMLLKSQWLIWPELIDRHHNLSLVRAASPSNPIRTHLPKNTEDSYAICFCWLRTSNILSNVHCDRDNHCIFLSAKGLHNHGRYSLYPQPTKAAIANCFWTCLEVHQTYTRTGTSHKLVQCVCNLNYKSAYMVHCVRCLPGSLRPLSGHGASNPVAMPKRRTPGGELSGQGTSGLNFFPEPIHSNAISDPRVPMDWAKFKYSNIASDWDGIDGHWRGEHILPQRNGFAPKHLSSSLVQGPGSRAPAAE